VGQFELASLGSLPLLAKKKPNTKECHDSDKILEGDDTEDNEEILSAHMIGLQELIEKF
jgi:hypothetical protein